MICVAYFKGSYLKTQSVRIGNLLNSHTTKHKLVSSVSSAASARVESLERQGGIGV